MAHDRGARFGKLVTQTSPVVGPGSYDTYEPSRPPRDLQRAYPFLSGATRKTLELGTGVGNLPGPGNYDPAKPRRRVPGGVSIDFTDTRSKPNIYGGPGPEAHNLPDDVFRTGVRKLRSHPGTWRGPAGNLWLGKPPRSMIADVGVSVPSKRDANGYDVRRGILVKNPPSEIEPVDFYGVPPAESNFTTSRYKGNFWSMMSGRDEISIQETPGPGAYETDEPINVAKASDEEYRSMKRATSRQPRYLDELRRRNLLEDRPAPNMYDTPKGPFDKDSTCECDEYTVERPAFGRGAKRFGDEPSESLPGPGTYDPVDADCSSRSRAHAPFGACAFRFGPRTSDSPGPGSYDLTADDLAKRIFTICRRSGAGRRAPLRFEGSSGSIRHEDTPSLHSIVTPDPRAKKLRVHHAVFKSATSRFKDPGPRASSSSPPR